MTSRQIEINNNFQRISLKFSLIWTYMQCFLCIFFNSLHFLGLPEKTSYPHEYFKTFKRMMEKNWWLSRFKLSRLTELNAYIHILQKTTFNQNLNWLYLVFTKAKVFHRIVHFVLNLQRTHGRRQRMRESFAVMECFQFEKSLFWKRYFFRNHNMCFVFEFSFKSGGVQKPKITI